jgi:hypothetical protein
MGISLYSSARYRGWTLPRWSICFVTFFAIYTLLFITNDGVNEYTRLAFHFPPTSPYYGAQNLTYLEKYNLSSSFTFSRRLIETKLVPGERKTLTYVNGSLFPEPQIFQLPNITKVVLTPSEPVALEVPFTPAVADASILSFGIATTLERLNDSIPQLRHWLPDTGATLHVVVPPDPKSKKLEADMRLLGMNVTITSSDSKFAINYFSQVQNLYNLRTESTEWIALIDDDTFFPSIANLVNHLRSHDSSTMKIVAPMSDDFDQIKKHGLMPFGGGGIFLSTPMAAHLANPEVFDKCLKTEKYEGDQILAECINKHTSVRPIYDMDLHQMDLKGDVSGFFESGRRSLSLHHWRSWFDVDMPAVALVSEICGDEGILMRWEFESDVVLSNGFSVVRYPGGIGVRYPNGAGGGEWNMEEMELTWDGDGERFMHSLGPLREKLKVEQEKISYAMVDTSRVFDKKGMFAAIKQTYLHRGVEGANDEVLELIWTKLV